jgi:flagellar biosynthesis/type III secretory pathway M-ring protein FliF/YscJ
MDSLKSQFDRIQQQLAGLSASQKMLAACLVLIIVATVSWWGKYAAAPEMAPVVDRPLAAEDVVVVRQQLQVSGIPSQVVDGKVMVPAERLAEAAADLTYSGALPKASKIDFQALVKDMNPFTPQSTTEAQFNHYNQMRLAEVIAKYPGVQSADVIVAAAEKSRIGGQPVLPSATVSIFMKRGEPWSQKLVDAAGHFIAASNSSLSWNRVKVIVDGQLRAVRDPQALAGAAGGEYREVAEKFEKDYEERVRQHFKDIPDLSVSVSVKVTVDSKHTRSIEYDKNGVIVKPLEENERTIESNTPVPNPAGEAGAQGNMGMTIAAAAMPGQATTSENESKIKNKVLAGEQVTETTTPPGVGTPVSADVRIPRSYIARVIKQERGGKPDPNAPEPDEAAIQERFRREMASIRGGVKNVVGLDKEEAVLVSMFVDGVAEGAGGGGGVGAAAAAGFSTASVAAVAGAHSREILLGGLAVVSLFMVSMMVRRGNPLPAVVATTNTPMMPMPVLDASESLAGEVSEGKQMLDAMELDDDAVRAQQMLDQVSSMVEENPDAAAGLVKRWLNRP